MPKKQTAYHISKLIYKSVSQTINTKEKEVLEDWLKTSSNKELFAKITRREAVLKKELLYKNSNKEDVYKRIQQKIQQKNQSKLFRLKVYKMAKYAAVLLIFLAVGNVIYKTTFDETTITENAIKKIKPGYEKATLVLSDGTTINLEEHKNELIVSGNLAHVQNTEDGLVYSLVTQATKIENGVQPLKYNTLQVPIGGMYQVKLPDGTKVWLNSATSLTYPERFNGEQRVVELVGEAYFEVTKDAKEFIVKTRTADITVLGTQFNVSSYDDDSFFSSTLVEGKIKLATSQNVNTNSSTILAPNQRGVIHKDSAKIQVASVETEVYTAWKEGKFYFERERLDQILTRMGRWYNVDVVFEDDSLKEETFTGVMLKDKSIDNLLNMISKTTSVNYIITKSKLNDKYELKLTRD